MSKLQLLQASVDSEDTSDLRILVDGKYVKYLTIGPGVYSNKDMCFGPRLFPLLPPLPTRDWNQAHIARNSKDERPYFKEVTRAQLPSITHVWHPRRINHLDLQWGHKLRSNVYEATFHEIKSPILIKFARFPYEIQQIDDETQAYKWIDGHGIGPAFLGHVTEEGRVIGFMMELISNAQHAEPENLSLCQKALTRLHDLGVLHGDINKHNFLIQNGRALLIDFETAERCNNQKDLEEELQSVEKALRDTSGRGGTITLGAEE
jgi:tRNA A-37 threonylcarbamoyl transferase component Bud32